MYRLLSIVATAWFVIVTVALLTDNMSLLTYIVFGIIPAAVLFRYADRKLLQKDAADMRG